MSKSAQKEKSVQKGKVLEHKSESAIIEKSLTGKWVF